MTATEIGNITGIYEDDMLNAACECERKIDTFCAKEGI